MSIPAGTRVILDTSTPALHGLTIPAGSALEFARKDVTLTTEWVMVHGELRIGSTQQPFTHRAQIRLTDNVTGENIMGMGDRVLAVMGGSLELHGEERTAWTRLAARASAGSSTLRLEAEPDWRPGDSLTVASTDFDAAQTEQVAVQFVDGAEVTLATPLQNTHWALRTTKGGHTLTERAEVGLLTRSIRIMATEDADAAGFGAQTMVMGTSTARVSGVEFTRVGQRNLIRRYPFHFHRLGRAPGSYFSGNSVHNSYNRCVTVHGTSDIRVENNVTYNTVGHCVFLEDGDEVDNVIAGNLVTLVHRPRQGRGESPLLPSDSDAAGYWIPNPDNVVTDNVAAGTPTGFWYALPEHPTGLGATGGQDTWNRRTPLGAFSGNVAHSGGTGLNVDDGPRPDGSTESTWYRPVVDPTDEDSAPAPAVFTDFTAYKQRIRGAWLRGENLSLTNSVLADNAVGVTFAAHRSGLSDSLLLGETSNTGQANNWEPTGEGGRTLPRNWDAGFPIRGFEFYDGHVSVTRSAFSGFIPNTVRRASGLGYLTENEFAIDPKNSASQLTWLDDSNRVWMLTPSDGDDGDKAATFTDLDGTVTGTAGRTVTASSLLRDAADCSQRAAWNAAVCSGEYVRLWLHDVPSSGIGPITATNARSVSDSLVGAPDDHDYFSMSARVGESYSVIPTNGTSRIRLGIDSANPGDTVALAVPFPGSPSLYRDWWVDNRNRMKLVPLADLMSTTGDSYALSGGVVYLKLVVRADKDYAAVDLCATDLCR